ncbi:MAG: hypothetical protein GX660_26835, partial [Clostridiaceae bacterium]|nr:hypothetical protein [Clostridiaceae bacterium]
MKRALCYLAAICMIISVLLTNTYAKTYQSYEEAIYDANMFLESKMGLVGYYRTQSEGRGLNTSLAKGGIPAFENEPVFVYGDQETASIETTSSGRRVFAVVNGVTEYRAIGYARDGSVFPNPVFPKDNEGYLANDKKWVKEPWKESRNTQVYGEHGEVYSRNMSAGIYNYIHNWIKTNRFTPNDVEFYTGQRNFFTANIVDPPEAFNNNFEDFLYIIQPPTEHAWGLGIAFYYWNGYNNLNYRTFLLKPFAMLARDLSAHFEPLPSSVGEGEEVLVGVNIKSTFDTSLDNIPYKWEITNENGDPVPATFLGHATSRQGLINNIAIRGESMLYASFRMPANTVKIRFVVNENGDRPTEKLLDNNVLDSGQAIKSVEFLRTTGEIELDYNVLSRNFSYPLANRNIVAELIKPRGDWSGNAQGTLRVTNQALDLLRNFTVRNNEPVDEASEIISRNPRVAATIQRSDFRDDPKNRIWLDWPKPAEPVIREGNAVFRGSVTRPYTYTYYCSDDFCMGHEEESTTSAAFNPGINTRIVKAFVYNGKSVIPPKNFSNKIDNNTDNSLKKNMLWRSEPYKFDVVRWMCHQAEDNTLYDWTTVPGRYQRTFTQQNSADIQWSNESSMEKDYSKSREAARNRDYRKSEYDKAVFASDIDFKNEAYPIKSGYYFNPTGTYTFTISTVTYKPTRDDTKDHKDLVDAMIDSFRYESDLMYINSYKEAVNIKGELLPERNGSYGRRPAALTAKDPIGIDDTVLLKVLDRSASEARYKKKVEELQHTEESGGDTHVYWKEILEGYEESGTMDSRDKFKYREYIRNGQNMYRITEETTVEIQ